MRNAASEQKESEFRQRINRNSNEAPGSVIHLHVPRNRCDRRDTVPLFRPQVSEDIIRGSICGRNNREYMRTNALGITMNLKTPSIFLTIL